MRKRRRVKIKKNKNKKARKPKWLYIVVFIAIVFVIVFLFLSRSVWKKDSKLVFVIGNELSGNSIFVLDPTSDSISETLIPHSLWLDSAYGLGDWKLGSLWQHGRNEKLGGKLVSESLTKNLYIPVYAWIYSDNNIHDKSYFSLLKTLMTSKDTNLTIRDRIRTAYFLASKSKKEIIDTGNFFEQSDKLENGTFTLSGRYTPKIGPYVFDEYTTGDTRIGNYGNESVVHSKIRCPRISMQHKRGKRSNIFVGKSI